MILGIVGHEAAKFTATGEAEAKRIITAAILGARPERVVSGGCHLGGVDIWAEEIARALQVDFSAYLPEVLTWDPGHGQVGYKQRNERIAAESDLCLCVVVDKLPPTYHGMRFDFCYHCKTSEHIKSGGCWTAKRCKSAAWEVVHQ